MNEIDISLSYIYNSIARISHFNASLKPYLFIKVPLVASTFPLLFPY
jgi:hypothetical protein